MLKMSVAEVGKVYKYYKGDKYKIIDLKGDMVLYEDINTKEQYSIRRDFWESVALNNNEQYVERFKACN